MVRPNTREEWTFADGEWQQVRHAVEDRYCFDVLDNGCRLRIHSAIVGFLEGEDERNRVALGDAYRLDANDRVVVKRYPLEQHERRRWVPVAAAFAEANPELPADVVASLSRQPHIRQRYAPRGPHPSRAVIEERLKGVRHSPTEIEPVRARLCSLCHWLIGGEHREKECPTRNHPAIPRRWRGIEYIPEPKGVLQSDRAQVATPSTVEELARVMWIDHDGRYWVANSKKYGNPGV